MLELQHLVAMKLAMSTHPKLSIFASIFVLALAMVMEEEKGLRRC